MSGLSAVQMVALVRAAAARGLNAAAEDVRQEAASRAPHRTGALAESLTVDEASARDLEATVGTDLPYAVYQHESLKVDHPTGRPKFLESAAIDAIGDVEKVVGAEVAKALGG